MSITADTPLAKEIMKYAGQGDSNNDCDCCFILGIGKCWLHRTPIHKFDQALRDCIPLRKSSIGMSFDGCIIKWRPVFSKVSNRWIFVNSEARESKVVFQKMVLLQETIENMTNMEIMESMEDIILT